MGAARNAVQAVQCDSNSEYNSTRLWKSHQRLVLHAQPESIQCDRQVGCSDLARGMKVELIARSHPPVITQKSHARFKPRKKLMDGRTERRVQSRHHAMDDIHGVAKFLAE